MSAEPLAGETYMLGWVANGTDSYLISGDISRFHFDESVNIYVNEEVVENPVQFVWTALTFKSTDRDHATNEFSVSGAIYSEDRHHLD